MHPVDWLVVLAYFGWIVFDGLRRSRSSEHLEGYFLANRSLPWWAVGLSVMATQVSAITLVGTTGRGYAEGMSVLQLYFGLPIAMILLSLTLVPFFYRSGVYTAYEYLERRFDVRTRTLASLLFQISRGLSCGAVISAPAVILSIVFGWDFRLTVAALSIPAVLYTIRGGVQAVTWADVNEMIVILIGVAACVVVLILGLPDHFSLGDALRMAGTTGRLQSIDFSTDLTKTYTFWSGLIGGLFLSLSYFGCDQSQVQRYLTAKSVDEGRHSLLMSAYFKIPLQFVIPLIGVLMFTFYVFTPSPMLFNHVHDAEMRQSGRYGEYQALEQRHTHAHEARRVEAERLAAVRKTGDPAALAAAEDAFLARDKDVNAVRGEAAKLVREVTKDSGFGDVNYVFPTFVTTHMPIGFVGLIVAAIIAASVFTVAAELNSLATASVMDLYKRHYVPDGSDAQYLRAAKIATGFWGVFACIVAFYAASLGPLIDVVNRFGSFFYGSLLGVFVLAIGTKRATSLGAFVGLFAGMAAVGYAATYTNMAFLWHNVVGAVTVVVVGMLVSAVDPRGRRAIEAQDASRAQVS